MEPEGNIKINLTFGSPILVYSSTGYKYAIEKAESTRGWTFPAIDKESSLGYQDGINYFINCVKLNRRVMKGIKGEDG